MPPDFPASLPDQVTDDAVNLLDHRFRQTLGLGADFDGGDCAARDYKTRHLDEGCSWYNLSKRAIATTTELTNGPILGIENALFSLYASAEPGRLAKQNQVLLQKRSDAIAQA